MADDPYKYFRIEARELIDLLGKAALELEKAGSPETLARMLRYAHTLKGAARVVRQPEIADRAHAIEDVLAPLRDRAEPMSRDQATRVLGLLDDIAARLAGLDAPTAPAPATATPAAAGAASPPPIELRADAADVDAVREGVLEAVAQLAALRANTAALDRARQLADLVVAQLASPGARHDRDAAAQRAVVEDLREVVRRCDRELRSGLDQIERELGQVRDATEHLRLVPIGALFTMLERTARDAADALGKQVAFEADGGATRLDARVLATLQGALVQLVRNAIAHGVEPPRDRLAAGKPGAGRVRVEVARRGGRIAVRCRDDGRGVDLDAVRAVAVRRCLAVPDAADAGALVALLLRGGISTTTEVTEVAGRGVGLDVVRAAVEQLAGEVHVETRPGAGTTFELVVPASLAAVEALVVGAAGTPAAVPLDAVRATRRLAAADVSRTPHGEALAHDGAMIPLLQLAPALRAGGAGRASIAVIVEAGGRTAAVAVDQISGARPVIVRPLPAIAAMDPIVAGAALDARGNPKLVLDPEAVVAAAHRERAVERAAEPAPIAVLVIDDSLTTRMLEQSILESAGYDVDTATSGEQGLEAARRKRYALFLVDVEMPGIDGFTFVERVRADAALRDTPAILVTSRASAEDRQRGARAGAQGYIVKSEFDQVELLARIQHLVRGDA